MDTHLFIGKSTTWVSGLFTCVPGLFNYWRFNKLQPMKEIHPCLVAGLVFFLSCLFFSFVSLQNVLEVFSGQPRETAETQQLRRAESCGKGDMAVDSGLRLHGMMVSRPLSMGLQLGHW